MALQFTLVTRRPYCPGRPKELCFTTLSLAMETMGMRLSVVKQSFFGPPGQYDSLVTRAISLFCSAVCALVVPQSWHYTTPVNRVFILWFFLQSGKVIPMPVPSSYNDITEDRKLRDFIGWVWYEKEVYAPRAWESNETRVVLRFEATNYNTIVVSQWHSGKSKPPILHCSRNHWRIAYII